MNRGCYGQAYVRSVRYAGARDRTGAADHARGTTQRLSGEPPCFGDLTGDGRVDLADLVILPANFATPSDALPEDGDLDGDGDVDLTDLALMLSEFGTICG